MAKQLRVYPAHEKQQDERYRDRVFKREKIEIGTNHSPISCKLFSLFSPFFPVSFFVSDIE